MRFFFDIREDGNAAHDEEGVDLVSHHEALYQAARTAAEICVEVASKMNARVQVSIRDAEGQVVGDAVVTLAISAAHDDA